MQRLPSGIIFGRRGQTPDDASVFFRVLSGFQVNGVDRRRDHCTGRTIFAGVVAARIDFGCRHREGAQWCPGLAAITGAGNDTVFLVLDAQTGHFDFVDFVLWRDLHRRAVLTGCSL